MRIKDIDTGLPVTFSNSNNVSFGTSGDVITASAQINISAGTTSNNLSAITFSNSNGVSFGLNASTITASVATSLTNINVSAGTTSNNLSAITFSNSNGVSFGLNGSTLTASVGVASSWTASDSATSLTIARLAFTNSNNVTLTLSTTTGGSATLVASVATSLTNINVSAGTTSNNLSAVTFSNANNVSFGLNGSTITATVTVASTQGSINLSAGTTSNLASAFTFSNSNNVSFGLNASTITASANPPTLSIWNNMSGEMVQLSTNDHSVYIFPFNPEIFPGVMTASTFFLPVNITSSQSTSSGSLLFSIGIYTLNNSTISLLNSAATSITWAAVSNNSTGFMFNRWLTIHSSQWSVQPVFTQTNYWIGICMESSNATQSLSLICQNFINTQGRFGFVGVSQTSSGNNSWYPFNGVYTGNTAALPVSISTGQIFAAQEFGLVPYVLLNNVMSSF